MRRRDPAPKEDPVEAARRAREEARVERQTTAETQGLLAGATRRRLRRFGTTPAASQPAGIPLALLPTFVGGTGGTVGGGLGGGGVPGFPGGGGGGGGYEAFV